MRYRGGGVGHRYMREIEPWLAETRWGSDDILTTIDPDSDVEMEENDEALKKNERNSEDEVSDVEGAVSDATADSDRAERSDIDPDAECASDKEGEGDEETLEGVHGFGGF